MPAVLSLDTERARTAAAIAAVLGSMACYGAMDAASRVLLLAGYAPAQLVAARCLAAFALVGLVMAARRLPLATLRTAQPRLQLLNGVVGAVSMLCALAAFARMPLAEASAIVYAAPIAVTLLTPLVLGEPTGPRRVIAAIVGFLGVLIMVRPAGGLEPAALLALASMLLYAVSNVLKRRLARTDHPLASLLYGQSVFLAVTAPMLIWLWRDVAADHVALFALAAAIGAVAVMLLFVGYGLASPAVVAPFDYTVLIWALIWGFAIWGETPDATAFAGMGVIVAAGMTIAWRELARARESARPAR